MGLKSEVAVNSRPGRTGRNKTESLVKQIIETTRCTNAEAEEALQENQNDIELAVLWLLDRGESVWTEQKSRKAKKDEVERPVRERQNKRNGPKGAPSSTNTTGAAPASGVTGGRSNNNENRRPREGRPDREPRESRPDREPRADRAIGGDRQERFEPRGERRFERGNRAGGRQNRENGGKPEESSHNVETNNKPAAPVNSIWGGKSSFAEKVAGSKKPAIDKFDSPALSEQPVTQTEGKASGVWAAGQVYTRTAPPPPPATNPADVPGAPAPVKPEPMKNAAGPLSFAAILAKKPAPPKPVEPPVEATPASTAAAPQTSTQAAEAPEASWSPEPSPQPTPVKPAVADEVPASSAVPETSATNAAPDVNTVSQSLTSQLKNDLGLSSSSQATAASASPLISAAPSSSTAAPVNAGRGTVEFFGYNPEPTPAPVVVPEEPAYKPTPPVAEVVTSAPQVDYSRQLDSLYKAPVESTPSPSKPTVNAAAQLATYGIQQQQPQQQSLSLHQQQTAALQQAQQHQQQQQQLQQDSIPRRLGYAQTSTVSFPPENRQSALPAVTTVPPTAQPTHKAPVTAQSAVNHLSMAAMHQQHTSQQQQMYNAPMYNAGFPYALYSPVAGRDDQHYAATPYMPYYDLNLAQVLPPMHLAAQVHQQQQQQQASQQSTHRSDQHHGGYGDLKSAYGQQPQQTSNTNSSSLSSANQRDSSLSSNTVAPPPGFAGHPNATPSMFHNVFPMQQFMQQPKVNHMYQQGLDDTMDLRQQHQSKIYGQQQDKYAPGGNVRDRLNNMGAAQPTPPPQGSYQQYGSNMNSVLNSKKPSYHGAQWNN
uniref:UBA domain-containing protein n=1 Tax=Panagrellus redivivus TaxID=6233 RepID=A0A7E4VGZ9_PANRE